MAKHIISLTMFILALGMGLVAADGAHDFNETKKLIDSGVSCSQLTDEELEGIGDYYMEQMHPGSEHDLMDQMMGGEGSPSLEQMHINMARRLYCNETTAFGGMMGGGMMGYGITDGSMMGGSWGMGGVLGLVFWALLIVLLILAIVWLYKKIAGREAGGTSLDILKRRYASGQISRKEFEKMKADIA